MKNNIIIIILVIIIGMVAFWYLGKNNVNNGSSITADTQSTNSADAIYIYNILKEMELVTLTNNIFSSPLFQNLKDNTAAFPSQAAGRNNPFAPVGTDTLIPGQSTPSTTTSPKIN